MNSDVSETRLLLVSIGIAISGLMHLHINQLCFLPKVMVGQQSGLYNSEFIVQLFVEVQVLNTVFQPLLHLERIHEGHILVVYSFWRPTTIYHRKLPDSCRVDIDQKRRFGTSMSDPLAAVLPLWVALRISNVV